MVSFIRQGVSADPRDGEPFDEAQAKKPCTSGRPRASRVLIARKAASSELSTLLIEAIHVHSLHYCLS